MEAFDFIIVGAGSAGCVLADRLSADGRHSVLLLEFGGSDRSIYIQMPSALSIPMNIARNTTGCTRRSRSRISTAGGCTRRAARCSAARRRSTAWCGCAATRSISTAGRRMARRAGVSATCCRISSAPTRMPKAIRNTAAPAARCTTRYGSLANPLHRAWLEAARQAGYPATPDYNGFQQEGFGRMGMSVHRGRRWSAANAYLRPAMRRPNLHVLTHALATRIAFDGRRAVGVALSPRRRRACGARAARGDPGRRPDQQPATAEALGHRAGGGAARARHRRAPRRCPASARTCRITWSSISRSPAASRSRCIRRCTRRRRR